MFSKRNFSKNFAAILNSSLFCKQVRKMVIEGRKALLIEPLVIPSENIINILSINRKFCVYCGDAPTHIAYFDVGESVLLEQYCDNCIKAVSVD